MTSGARKNFQGSETILNDTVTIGISVIMHLPKPTEYIMQTVNSDVTINFS